MARMNESTKRRRRWARVSGQFTAMHIARAIQYQQDALWFQARPGYGNLATQWLQMSDQALDLAVAEATYAAHWANLSKEAF